VGEEEPDEEEDDEEDEEDEEEDDEDEDEEEEADCGGFTMHFFNAAAIFSFSSPLNMLTILGS
jgi:hypothetical protein